VDVYLINQINIKTSFAHTLQI